MTYKERRKKYREEGKCFECGKDPLPNRTRCMKCKIRHDENNKRTKKRYKEQNKCSTCGCPLMPEDIKAGKTTCIDHRERLTAGVSQWGRS